MRMGYRITLSILTIMILMTISVGSSYSYYAVSSTQEEPNYLSTTCFNISFEDEDSINLTNAYPMSRTDALVKLKPYKFKVTNTCTTENASEPTKVSILLNYIKEKNELQNYIYFRLVSNKGFELENWILDLDESQIENIDSSKYIGIRSMAPGESEEFSLYLWIDENACIKNNSVNTEVCDESNKWWEDNVMGKTFEGQISVYAYM